MSRASHNSQCNQETAETTQKQEDLQAGVAKHSSKLTQPLPDLSCWRARSRHFSWSWVRLRETQFQMDTTRAVEGNLSTTRTSLEQGVSKVQKAPDTLRLQAHPRGHHVCNETCSRSLQGIRTCPAWCEDAPRANIMCRRCVVQRFEQSVAGQHNKHASEYA